MSNKELEQVEQNVGDDVPDDDDHANMANPLNINSELDDIGDEFDEEEY